MNERIRLIWAGVMELPALPGNAVSRAKKEVFTVTKLKIHLIVLRKLSFREKIRLPTDRHV